MSALVLPRPYPGCAPCGEMAKEWTALTEPASPDYNRDAADQLADAINRHRSQDEAQAPAL
ncbi:hypothetical protein [Streptomyces sp. IBSNAI001]|uniref:hypothetical protein n=1 Tax=Streptomyces sp. IBSNAI001 TaxID=3457499 RepID=UPI003FD5754B